MTETLEGETLRAGDEGRLAPGMTLEGVRLEGLDLSEARLPDLTLIECALEGVDLTLADLTGAEMRGVRFEACRLLGVDVGAWRDEGLGLEVVLRDCDLTHLQASELDLRAWTFAGGRAPGATFAGCDLRGVSFAGCDLGGAHFARCDLREADLRGATGYVIDPTANRVRGLRASVPEALSFLGALGIEVA